MSSILYGFVFVCLLGIATGQQFAELFATNCQKPFEFECDPSDPKLVLAINSTLHCPGTTVCNTILIDNCNPCIEKSTTCYDKFTCIADPSKVIVQNVTFDCPKNYQCNAKFEDPCDPCIMVPCNTDIQYVCDPVNETMGTLGNIKFVCEAGNVCNKNKLQPCTPCIPSKAGNITTTTSAPPTRPPVDEDTDCNDGYGTTRACRPSNITNDLKEKYYYRCSAVWWWYEKVLVPCSEKANDLVCQNVNTIC